MACISRAVTICSLFLLVSSSQCFAQETVRDLVDLAKINKELVVLGDRVAGEWPSSSSFVAGEEECTCTIVGRVNNCEGPPSIPCTLEDVPCSASMDAVIANCQALIRQSAEGTDCHVEFPGGDTYQCILPKEKDSGAPSEEKSK